MELIQGTLGTPAIFGQLAAVMGDCREVAKRDANTEQRYYFRGIDAVVNAVGPILRKHGVMVMPTLVHVDYGERTSKSGNLGTVCRVVVDYVFTAAEDGTSITTRVAAEAMDYSDKATAKAMSVAFRTALLQALALPTDDRDPDADNPEAAAPKPTPATQRVSRSKAVEGGGGITEAQVTKIGASMSELGIKARADALLYVKDVIGREVDSRNELTKAEAHHVIEALEADLDKQAAAQRAAAGDAGTPANAGDDPWKEPEQ
jgi:ERF superfamily protein